MKKTVSGVFPFIQFDRSSEVSFYKQIYDGYRKAIITGLLRPGNRLPSTRELATELKISRMPVVIAYEQLLHEGYIEGKTGAGTYVNTSIPDEIVKPVSMKKINELSPRLINSPASSASRLGSPPSLLGSFRVSLPALDMFPDKIWSRLMHRHAKKLPIELMAYGNPFGYRPLCEAIAEYLRTARAVRCEANQILITSGSQMALHLCAIALLKSGDEVCMEEPGYSGARDALKRSGATISPVLVDDEGINIDSLINHGNKVRAVYVTPSHQYPLGISMSASRRLELIDWAQHNNSWIIEDDYDSEFRYSSRPIGSLQGMDNTSRVIYIGTFSKVMFPSLRVGYLVIPNSLLDSFSQLREAFDIFPSIIYQLALADFILEGHFARHIRRMRTIYLSRRNALVDALREHAPPLEIYNADAGLHLSAFLPEAIDDNEVVSRAAQLGITATSLSSCYFGNTSRSGLILGFGGANERQIAKASRILGNIIKN